MIHNYTDHPYFQLGEEVFIDISKEYGIIESSIKTSVGVWEHKVRVVNSLGIILSSPLYKEDYPTKPVRYRTLSEVRLSKLYEEGTMSFKELISYCNGGAYGV